MSYAVTMLQDNILDLMMNFAAILVIREVDNAVGVWFLTQITALQEWMDMKVTGWVYRA